MEQRLLLWERFKKGLCRYTVVVVVVIIIIIIIIIVIIIIITIIIIKTLSHRELH